MGGAFCGGLRERRDLFCLRRGTFPAREKYPKARQKPYGFWTSFFVDKRDICRTWPKLCIVSPPAPLPLTV